MTSIGIQYLTLQETRRSNLVNEGIKQQTLQETVRSNKVREDISQRSLDETIRSNLANENIRKETNSISIAQLQEQSRHNLALEDESIQHNRNTEDNTRYQINMQYLQDNVSSAHAMKDMGIDSVGNRIGSASQTIWDNIFGSRGAASALSTIFR